MTSFDERFADRAREVFDTYAEPVDEPTWERVQATLAKTQTPARDRAPIAGAWTRRSRMLVALATLVLVGGVGSWAVWQTTSESPEDSPLAVNTDALRSTPIGPRPERLEAISAAEESENDATPSTEPSEAPLLAARSSADLSPVRPSAPSPARQALARAERRSRAESEVIADTDVSDRADDASPAPEPLPSDLASEASFAAPADEASDVALAPPVAAGVPAVQTRNEADEAQGIALGEIALGKAETSESSSLGVDLVLATNAAFSGRQLAEGAGLTAGLSREWRVRNGLAISTGALAAYTRLETTPSNSVRDAITSLGSDPSRSVDVTTQTTLSTLALEIPLDVIVDVADTGPGRIRAGLGLTTSLYLAQTFEDTGERYALEDGLQTNGGVSFSSDAFSETETAEPLSHLDLGRQANVSLGYTLDRGRAPLSLDAYTRLPLGGVTSRDLKLTLVGFRLRVGL